MKVTNLAISYRTSVLVLTIILVVGGLLTYSTIPKESFPSIEIPNIIVTTVYPGASPDDIESLITQPIEREIQSVNGIKEIRSTSTEGVSTVVIEFDPDVSIDDAFQKIRDKVDIAKTELPSEAEEPLVNEIDLQEFPIMTINLAADYSLARLKDVADDLADELESISSILQVDVVGALEREVQVNVDLNALKAYNLAFGDIVAKLREENTNIPGGSIDVDRLNYLVRVDGEIEHPSEIEELVLDTPAGRPVYVRDVADVVYGFKDRTSFARLQVLQIEEEDGSLTRLSDDQAQILPVISLNVKKRSGENILDTARDVEAVLTSFAFPGGTRIEITGDMSEQVLTMVKDLENNIISGLIFVVAVLLFFLGMRNAFLVGIAIPLSMFVSFLVFDTLGYTLNFVILFSLIIALGMLVDNAVVIVENIYRFREEGHPRFEAARLATAEVAGPVVASTATTVAAFAPMLFWPGIIGEFMSYLPLTLIVTLSSSLFVALIINPVITGIFVRLDGEEHSLPRIVKMTSVGAILVLGAIIGFANWKSLFVLTVAFGLLYYSHKFVFKPIADRFVRTGLPEVIRRYKAFLQWMLERDYTVARAYLRNTFSLSAFTLGFAALLLGGLVMSMAGMGPAMILLVPGGILLLVGVAGILVHTLESVFLGARSSVRTGIIFAIVAVAVLGLMSFGERAIDLTTVLELLILPAVVVLFGLLGVVFKKRDVLILTDNRARLLNGTLGGLISIFVMFAIANPGTEFFPDTDPTIIQVSLESPLGTNIDESNRIATEAQSRINQLLDENPVARGNIKNLQTGVGVGGDINFGGGAASPEQASVTINLVDYGDRGEKSRVTMTSLREQLRGIPGVEIEFTKDEAGPPTGAPVNIEVSGSDFDRIVTYTKEIKQLLIEAAETGAIPGLVDITDNLNTGRPELHVEIDRERAARFGLNTSMIASTIRSAINGIESGTYRDGEDEYDIVTRLSEADRSSLESLKNLTILDEGQQVPLVAVADFSITGGLGSITRLDLERVATVGADVADGFNSGAVLEQVVSYLASYERSLPAGYSLSYTGENQEQDEAFGFLTTALLIAIGLIFMIMVAQFNHVSTPFIIMVAVGLSLIGVLLGLILTRTPFGLMTFIGVISLAGIVVNNNIVLIDYIMQLRDRGLDKQMAIIEGGATRLRPVLLTALTTVIGLIPLTFGIGVDFVGLVTDLRPNLQFGSENTQFWGAMGTSIISGLTFATFLTLVIVPVMYSVFDSLASKLYALFHEGESSDLSGNGMMAGAPPDVALTAPALVPSDPGPTPGH
jgi:multidrug efflux pump subunit AcrB